MIQNINGDEPTARAQLNNIADHWTVQNEYPHGISRDDVAELIQVLFDELEDHVETLVTDTTFTRREAEVWVLRTTRDDQHHVLTNDAAALILSTPGGGFNGGWSYDEHLKLCRPATTEDVQDHLVAATHRVERAKETLEAGTLPDQEAAPSNLRTDWSEE